MIALQYFLESIKRKYTLLLGIAISNMLRYILETGWNRVLISPIYKSGDKLDSNNYRGISVSSNLGKAFCCIINAQHDTKWKRSEISLLRRRPGVAVTYRKRTLAA